MADLAETFHQDQVRQEQPTEVCNLVFNEASLERLAAESQGDDKEKIEEGIRAAYDANLVLVNSPMSIEAFGFVTSRKHLKEIEIQLKKEEGEEHGKVIKVPAHIFERAFGIKHYSDADGYEGWKIGDRSITPREREREIEKTLDTVRFDSVKLGGDRLDEDEGVYIWKGPSKQPTERDVDNFLKMRPPFEEKT